MSKVSMFAAAQTHGAYVEVTGHSVLLDHLACAAEALRDGSGSDDPTVAIRQALPREYPSSYLDLLHRLANAWDGTVHIQGSSSVLQVRKAVSV